MVNVTRLAHVGLRSPQMEEMERYFVDVLGLWVCARDDDGVVHLTGGGAGSYVELMPGDAEALDHVALELPLGTDPEAATAELTAGGLEVTPWDRSDPCSLQSLRVHDPEGNVIQLVIPSGEFVEQQEPGPGIRPIKIGHVATRVRNAQNVADFYVEHLGFRWSDSIGDGFVFLRCSADHHAVNPLTADKPGHSHHIAFELTDFLHTQRAMDRIAEKGLKMYWGPGRHGPGHNLFTYHHDPDGHIIELYTGMDKMSHEGQGHFDPRPWHTHRPQAPTVWDPESLTHANSWGIAPPEGFLD